MLLAQSAASKLALLLLYPALLGECLLKQKCQIRMFQTNLLPCTSPSYTAFQFRGETGFTATQSDSA